MGPAVELAELHRVLHPRAEDEDPPLEPYSHVHENVELAEAGKRTPFKVAEPVRVPTRRSVLRELHGLRG